MSDPRVVYDSGSSVWVAVAFDVTRTETVLSISQTSSPNGARLLYYFPSVGCPDQPRLAVTDQLVVITANLYSTCAFSAGAFIGGEVTVLSKSALLAGQLTASTEGVFGPDSRYFAITPAQPVTPLAGAYLVSVDAVASLGASLFTVNAPSDASLPARRVPIRFLSSPPMAAQPGERCRSMLATTESKARSTTTVRFGSARATAARQPANRELGDACASKRFPP